MSKSPAIIQAAEARADILRDLGADPAALVASLRAGYATNPDLGACAPQSVIACLYAVAQSGLLLGGPQPHVYLIPRGQVCTLQLGYHGALELARRHGGLSSVRTGVIYEGDDWCWENGHPPRFEHRPTLGERGKPLAVYALGYLDGVEHPAIEVARWSEVEIVRKKSRSPAWRDWPERMAMRLPLRRLCSRLSLSPGAARVLDLSGAEESGSVREAAVAAQRVAAEVEEGVEVVEAETVEPDGGADE